MGFAVVVSMVLFLRYIDHFAHLLRPAGLAAYVSDIGTKVLYSFWKDVEGAGFTAIEPGHEAPLATTLEDRPPLAVRSQRSRVVQAINLKGLFELARSHDCVFVLRCHIGDFVPEGETMLEVFGNDPHPS